MTDFKSIGCIDLDILRLIILWKNYINIKLLFQVKIICNEYVILGEWY